MLQKQTLAPGHFWAQVLRAGYQGKAEGIRMGRNAKSGLLAEVRGQTAILVP